MQTDPDCGTATELTSKQSIRATLSPDSITALALDPAELPPIDKLPLPVNEQLLKATERRIGLFELRRRLSRQDPPPSPCDPQPFDTLVGLVMCLAMLFVSHISSPTIHNLSNRIYVLVGLVATLVMATVALVAPVVASLNCLRIMGSDESLPSRAIRARYEHMVGREYARYQRRSKLLPTDAGGAPIDIDEWGDF